MYCWGHRIPAGLVEGSWGSPDQPPTGSRTISSPRARWPWLCLAESRKNPSGDLSHGMGKKRFSMSCLDPPSPSMQPLRLVPSVWLCALCNCHPSGCGSTSSRGEVTFSGQSCSAWVWSELRGDPRAKAPKHQPSYTRVAASQGPHSCHLCEQR